MGTVGLHVDSRKGGLYASGKGSATVDQGRCAAAHRKGPAHKIQTSAGLAADPELHVHNQSLKLSLGSDHTHMTHRQLDACSGQHCTHTDDLSTAWAYRGLMGAVVH